MAAGWMNDHARRLVDRDDVLVLIQDVERNFFRVRSRRVHRRKDQRDSIARRQAMGHLGALPIHLHATRADHFAELHSTVLWQRMRQECIEPLACLFRGDDKFQGLVGRLNDEC